MYSQWTLGRMTPFMLAGPYFLATLVAIGHVSFYHYLDGRALDETIPQSKVSATSTAFVFAFGATLGASLGTAFTQRLWHVFRKRPLTVSTIEVLHTALQNPASLFNWRFPRYAKIEYVFALLFWCIPAATIFPPGAIEVMSEGRLSNHLLSVPTFDPEFHPRRYHAYPPGINNRTVLNKQALFKAGVEGAYMMPLAEISKPVKQMLLSGEFVPTPPPQGCGQNCSYSISFVGPAFKCNDMPEVFNLSKLTMPTTGKLNMVQYSYGANYIGRENTRDGKQFPQLRNMLERYNSDTFDFEVYFSTIGVDHDYMRGIRCEAWQGQYHLDITYVLGVQHVKAEVKKEKALSTKMLSEDPNLFFYSNEWQYNRTENLDRNYTVGIDTFFRLTQLLAIRDAIVRPLLGWATNINTDSQRINNTMILETAYSPDPKTIPPSSLAQIRNYTDNKFQMRFTPAILEEIMVNATVTIISGRRWNTTADVTVETWNNYYRFSNRAHIFIPYSVVLMLALVFVTMGASALVTNGVPAESSSFLQVLCTTTGSRALENAAAGGCLGGTSSVNPDLANMLLLYGELTNVRTQRGWVKRAGFGPVDEVRELQKGQLYGVVDDDCLLSHNARAYLANKRTRESQYMHDIKGINVPIL